MDEQTDELMAERVEVISAIFREPPKDHSYEVSMKMDYWPRRNRIIKDFTSFDLVT